MSRGIAPRAQGEHPTLLALLARPEAPVRVGADFVVMLELACPHGCEQEEVSLTLAEPDGTRKSLKSKLAKHPFPFELTAPKAPGSHTWQFTVAAVNNNGLSHSGSSMSLTVDVLPHEASVAVWQLPDAARSGAPFRVKVGAKSTAGSVLAGQNIEIRDEAGHVLVNAKLGSEPWPGTASLLWSEAEIIAHEQPGMILLSAHLVGDAASEGATALTCSGLAHEAIPCGFTVNVVPAAEHVIEVTVIEQESGTPLADALVRIGAFRATTNNEGRTRLDVPKGPAEIVVWKTGYDAPDHPIDVTADARVVIAAKIVPDEDPDAHWKA